MFNRRCSIIAMIHLQPLPGSAGYDGSIERITNFALADADVYKQCGVDALLVENMHDVPYLKGRVEPETTAAMATVISRIKQEINLPLGVQVLAGANLEALGMAVAASLDFVRAEGFVFAHVGDEGIHEAQAAALVRRRAYLKAEGIKILADIKKKHAAHSITEDVSIIETAKAAEFFKADGVIVTGGFTGGAAVPEEVQSVREAVSCLVLVGSGVTVENVHRYHPYASGLIVGSSFKEGGHWANALDKKRVKMFMDRCAELEQQPV